MGQLSPILRNATGGTLLFWCPGCKCGHQVTTGEGPGPRWGYNGNPEAPTFTPSILVRSGHFVPSHKPGDTCWCTPDPDGTEWGFACGICHSYVIDGRIQFLDDCTHELAGQTVAIPEWPADHLDGGA